MSLKVIDFTPTFRFLILNASFQSKIYPPIFLSFSINPHISLSAALCANISGFRSPTCYISDGNSLNLVQKVIEYLEQMASAAFDLLKIKNQYVFDLLSASENVKSEKLKLNFEKFLKNLIVLGFNSRSYDLNLIKKQLI